eukprot:GEMP01010144.1.p1 GENE.GEMP01010144.1~~GEMP01010144.1.p1  ORF type:complete len:748 (+),score=125.79 GEMP01010144.1:188-2431(+)
MANASPVKSQWPERSQRVRSRFTKEEHECFIKLPTLVNKRNSQKMHSNPQLIPSVSTPALAVCRAGGEHDMNLPRRSSMRQRSPYAFDHAFFPVTGPDYVSEMRQLTESLFSRSTRNVMGNATTYEGNSGARKTARPTSRSPLLALTTAVRAISRATVPPVTLGNKKMLQEPETRVADNNNPPQTRDMLAVERLRHAMEKRGLCARDFCKMALPFFSPPHWEHEFSKREFGAAFGRSDLCDKKLITDVFDWHMARYSKGISIASPCPTELSLGSFVIAVETPEPIYSVEDFRNRMLAAFDGTKEAFAKFVESSRRQITLASDITVDEFAHILHKTMNVTFDESERIWILFFQEIGSCSICAHITLNDLLIAVSVISPNLVIEDLRTKSVERFHSLDALFSAIPLSMAGPIAKKTFIARLETSLYLSTNEARAVFDAIDLDRTGFVSRAKFLSAVHFAAPDFVLDNFRRKVLTQWEALERGFQEWERTDTRIISMPELESFCYTLDVFPDPADVASIFRRADHDNIGAICPRTLYNTIRGILCPILLIDQLRHVNRDAWPDVMDEGYLSDYFVKMGSTLQPGMFDVLDHDQDGLISGAQLKKYLARRWLPYGGIRTNRPINSRECLLNAHMEVRNVTSQCQMQLEKTKKISRIPLNSVLEKGFGHKEDWKLPDNILAKKAKNAVDYLNSVKESKDVLFSALRKLQRANSLHVQDFIDYRIANMACMKQHAQLLDHASLLIWEVRACPV